MAESHVVAALISKRAELAGLIEQMRKNAIGVVHRLTRSGTLIPAGRDGLGATWAVA